MGTPGRNWTITKSGAAAGVTGGSSVALQAQGFVPGGRTPSLVAANVAVGWGASGSRAWVYVTSDVRPGRHKAWAEGGGPRSRGAGPHGALFRRRPARRSLRGRSGILPPSPAASSRLEALLTRLLL